MWSSLLCVRSVVMATMTVLIHELLLLYVLKLDEVNGGISVIVHMNYYLVQRFVNSKLSLSRQPQRYVDSRKHAHKNQQDKVWQFFSSVLLERERERLEDEAECSNSRAVRQQRSQHNMNLRTRPLLSSRTLFSFYFIFSPHRHHLTTTHYTQLRTPLSLPSMMWKNIYCVEH